MNPHQGDAATFLDTSERAPGSALHELGIGPSGRSHPSEPQGDQLFPPYAADEG
jgi:hypothetical protein